MGNSGCAIQICCGPIGDSFGVKWKELGEWLWDNVGRRVRSGVVIVWRDSGTNVGTANGEVTICDITEWNVRLG